jgi:hypothetical membrane protein
VDASRDIWFYAKGAERYGPFTFRDLRAIALQGQLDPQVDLVWQAGTPEWVPAGTVSSLYAQPESPPVVKRAPVSEVSKATENESNVVRSSSASRRRIETQDKAERPHADAGQRGSKRMDFFFGLLVLPLIVWGICLTLLGLFGDSMSPATQQNLRWFVAVLPMTIIFLAVIRRLQNLEMNPLWFLGLLVPGLNLWIIYRCICAPEAYAVHERMDRPGKVVGIAYWAVLTFVILIVVAAFQWYGLKKSDLGNTRAFNGWLRETKERLNGVSSEAKAPD